MLVYSSQNYHQIALGTKVCYMLHVKNVYPEEKCTRKTTKIFTTYACIQIFKTAIKTVKFVYLHHLVCVGQKLVETISIVFLPEKIRFFCPCDILWFKIRFYKAYVVYIFVKQVGSVFPSCSNNCNRKKVQIEKVIKNIGSKSGFCILITHQTICKTMSKLAVCEC